MFEKGIQGIEQVRQGGRNRLREGRIPHAVTCGIWLECCDDGISGLRQSVSARFG